VAIHGPDTIIEWGLAGAGATTLIIFAVALQNFFKQPAALTRGQRLFQDLSILIGLTHGIGLVLLDSVSDLHAGLGVAMYVAALSLFLSAIEAARRVPMTRAFVYEPRCNNIIKQGPYRVIRHPIYLSYSLAWLAAPMATHNLVLMITAVGMIACYVVSAREEERRMMLGTLKDEFGDWQKRTWRLIPYLY
jgi:protein-S-isoprenylcysteine O-methyltransferase Ste14